MYYLVSAILGFCIGFVISGPIAGIVCMISALYIMHASYKVETIKKTEVLRQALKKPQEPEPLYSTSVSTTKTPAKNIKISTISSFNNPYKYYTVNLTELTCDCPDFVKGRSDADITDPRRCCKHIVAAFDMSDSIPESLKKFWPFIEYFRMSSKPRATNMKRLVDFINNTPIILYFYDYQNIDPEDCWVDIFWGGWKHSFNPKKDVWTYSARELERFNDIALWTYRKLNIDLPKQIEAGSIQTLDRSGINVKGKLNNGYFITAIIKPKASWMTFAIDSWKGRLNVKTGETEFPVQCVNIEDAVSAWLKSEYQIAKELKGTGVI